MRRCGILQRCNRQLADIPSQHRTNVNRAFNGSYFNSFEYNRLKKICRFLCGRCFKISQKLYGRKHTGYIKQQKSQNWQIFWLQCIKYMWCDKAKESELKQYFCKDTTKAMSLICFIIVLFVFWESSAQSQCFC